MAFNAIPVSSSSVTQPKRTTSFGQQAPGSSLLVDKTKAHIRRSTPDSEALASSDDEQDISQRLSHHQAPKPIRRASWLSDTNSARKSSHGASDAVPPSNAWDLGVGASTRSNSNTSFSPWGGSIWNDTQRNPPARLAELKTSEGTIGSTFTNEEIISSPTNRRESTSDGSIPFAIPLQPTLKTYRSQSYSVGQMEEEAANANQSRQIQTSYGPRTRNLPGFVGNQHRPTRPSMLSGDFSPENSTMLEQVREVADDDEASNGSSEAGVRLPGSYNRTMEQIALENILRQQKPYPGKTTSERSNSFSVQGSQPQRFAGSRSLYSQESVLEESDDLNYGAHDGKTQLSDPWVSPFYYLTLILTQLSFTSTTGNIENRTLENVKKGHWSSSLGFGGPQELPQSRRHSFADVPIRNQALNAGSDHRQLPAEPQSFAYGDANGRMPGDTSKLIQFLHTFIPDTTKLGTENLQRVVDVASFFSSNQSSRPNDPFRPSSSSSSIHQGYGGISQSPVPQFHHSLTPSMQSLYLVTFKAARAEFYYVQEGTGLEVKEGDLVIVEADRGTDLGTVAHKNLDWTTAKELKEKYAVEHYNWLMMFSRLKQNGQTSPPGSSASGRPFGSAIGGMRPHPSNQPADNGEIKPKMIKRLAQPYEIQMLREKEGNEAKAKRMCQQKVVEHHLAMEILDAEFQMDWKKLTFYYYADAYVNFNNLVTDLFKAYKTRIWMSAINPDSFVSPAPAGMPPFRGRDRFDAGPNPEGNGLMYSSLSDIQQPMNTWPGTQEMMTSAMAPSAYSHFFANQASSFPTMPMVQPDFGRNMYPGYRAPSPGTLQQQFGSAGRNPAAMNPLYNEQASNGGYPDQLRAFQGLSLGS